MALIGFPNQIKVTLGTGFNGNNGANGAGLDNGDEVILTKVSGQEKWTEDGTDTANKPNNRIRMRFNSSTSWRRAYFDLLTTPSLSAFTGYANAGNLGTGTASGNYNFLDVWNQGSPINGGPGIVYVTSFSIPITNGWRPLSFTAMEEYIPPSELGPDKTTYRYG